ncbi:MAG: protein kinase [Pirellulaceae bacterium]|nr:protein kinase [Pirellulaceae bacterium]
MAQVIHNEQVGPIGGVCPSEVDLAAFAEGELSEPVVEAIIRHLTHCPRCESSLARIAEQGALGGQFPPPALAAATIDEPECLRMQTALRDIPRRCAGANNQQVDESTDKTRLSTDNALPWQSLAALEITTTFVPSTPRTIGRYQVQSVLGEGGYGQVYLARDPQLDRQVAIKVAKFSPSVSRRLIDAFLAEAKTLAKFKHPGIVTVYDAGVDELVGCYIVMEYVDGRSLKEVMKAGKVPHEQAAKYIAQAAEAVHYAHKQNLIHRDLKPANLLLDTEGNLKVADFGLAIFEEQQRDHAGEIAGTFSYCSPEQIRGEVHHLDGRTDIWSLGVILYELFTGRRPFSGPNLTDEILHRPARPPRQIDDSIPADLERVCLKCLSKDASGRMFTALDLAHELRRGSGAIALAVPDQVEPEPLGNFAASIRRVGGRRLVLTAVLMFAFLAAGAYILRDRRTAPYAVDGVAVPLQPLRLLTRQPRPPFPVTDDTEAYTHYSQREALSLHTPSVLLLGLGETRNNSFRLRVDISATDRSGAGLFVGLRPAEAMEGTRRWQFEAICLKVTDDGRFLLERTLAEVLESESTFVINDPAIAVVEVEPVEVRRATLEVTIKGQSIVEVRWMGRRVPKLSGKTHLPPLPNYEGEFGVIGKNGTAWFHNAEFELTTPPSE